MGKYITVIHAYMKLVYSIADNIICSLGFTTAECLTAVNRGESGVVQSTSSLGVPEPFMASAINHDELAQRFALIGDATRYTEFEKLLICSISDAASRSGIDLASPGTLFILSTTKGNISLLDSHCAHPFGNERVNLWVSAREIALFFNNSNTPLVVSQACISGVSALLTAKMYLDAGIYKNVVVAGGDLLSKFVVSGFQSFKALSPTRCRPFDAHRDGLSLGEGAATVILGAVPESSLPGNSTVIKAGAISNDANHISGPSRTGEGLHRAIERTLAHGGKSRLAFVNAHGTATPFNDEMEAVALSRSGLESVPVNSFKAYVGHTLGAAGLVETILSAHSLSQRKHIQSLGYETRGVSTNMHVVVTPSEIDKDECLKTASGFGGCNAVVHLKHYR